MSVLSSSVFLDLLPLTDTQTHRSFSPPLLSALRFEHCTHLSHSQPQSSLQYHSDVSMTVLLPVVAF